MSKSKLRLGRGLSSLIGTGQSGPSGEANPAAPAPASVTTSDSEQSLGVDKLFHVELSKVRMNPFQPRRHFDDASISLLAESLKSSGLIQPIVVRVCSDGFELIAGERRYRAALEAGFEKLPAILREIGPAQQAEWALIENIHRQDLNPIERAEAYFRLIHEFGLTQERLAERLGEERSGIANHLRLLKLSEPVRGQLRDGGITLGHAKILAGIEDPVRQQALADQVIRHQLSVRKLEELIQPPAAAPLGLTQSATVKGHLADVENRLTQKLQMRVQVKALAGGKRGRVIVHYGSLDQFDELMYHLGVVLEGA